MTRSDRRRIVVSLVRDRAGLLAVTAVLALAAPLVASAPVRAIPTVTRVVNDPDSGAPLDALVPGTGGVRVGLGALLGALIGVGLLAAALSLLQGTLVARLNASLAADARIRLTGHLLRQPPSYHQRVGLGALLGPITGDTEMIAIHFGNLVPAAFGVASGAVAWSLTLAAGLAGSGVPVGSAAVVVAGVVGMLGGANAAAAWLTGRKTQRSQIRVQGARDAALGALAETLEGVDEIQAAAAEPQETRRLSDLLRTLARRQQTVALWGALGNSLTQVVVIVAIPGLVAAAALLDAPTAALAVVLPSLTFLQASIASATALWVQARMTRPAIDRVAALLADVPAIRDPERAERLDRIRGDLRFESVRFAYPGSDRPILDGVGFAVPAGATVAVVGDGGSGKSTLLRLALRFHDPDAGRVTLDGRDVREIPLADLRGRVAMLGQHSRLFARSVRDNLRIGAPEVEDAVVADACRTANADPVIAKLDGGLDAVVDPGAANLSGSERRRLALARVLARRPAVILLDEPEAGLSQAMAERLMADLREATRGKTCLVVTHRPDLLDTDSVVYLENGRVAAAGPHELLERTCEGYRGLLAQRRERRGEADSLSTAETGSARPTGA